MKRQIRGLGAGMLPAHRMLWHEWRAKELAERQRLVDLAAKALKQSLDPAKLDPPKPRKKRKKSPRVPLVAKPKGAKPKKVPMKHPPGGFSEE